MASLNDSRADLTGGFNPLWIEAPEGVNVALAEYSVTLISVVDGRHFEIELPLTHSMVIGAAAWRTSPSIEDKPVTATFEGATKKSVTFWGGEKKSHDSIYFSAEEIPRIGGRGQMILPDLIINGVRYPGPTLVFQRDRFFGYASFNC
ncbi:hypothetical protein [Salinisphaera sp. C84B14]|uniref:hypothetical protein n=1 Tax=Salinisphaera sp. C84B14 TaxID=1304155 RepID=UPI00334246E2